MRDAKRIIWAIVFLMSVLTVVNLPSHKVIAANNGSITSAQAYTLGTNKSGSITENGPEKQYYKFTLQSSGSIQISGSAYMERINLFIYDASANELWHVDPSWNSTSEVISIDESIILTSGTYYFSVGRYYYNGNYNFKIDFSTSSESFKEGQGGSNNTLATASNINADGTIYNAQIANNDEKDFFRFNLQQSGKINLNSTFYKLRRVNWYIYDENGIELIHEDPEWNNTTENIVVGKDIYLTSGNYYLCIGRYYYNGKYTFSISFTSSNETYAETNGGSNNTISTASALTLGNNYNGQLAVNDNKDFYKFSLSTKTPLSLSLTGDIDRGYIKIYDSSGNEISSRDFSKDNTTQKVSYSEVLSLEQGTYYISISKSYYDGDYTLNLSQLTQDNCPHDYESEWHSATYFEQGYRLYTCKWCGKTYQDEYSNKLILSKPTISTSYSYGMKKKLRIQWSSVYRATGYELSYATKKSFKGAKKIKLSGYNNTFRTIKKLKKKKWYYVRVRAYIQSDGRKAYSPWSGKVKIRTR